MAAPAPGPAPGPAAAPSGGGGNALTRKWGPLPVWGWLAIATAAAGLYYVLVARKKNSAAGGQGGLPQVPDIIIQNQSPGTTPPGPPPMGGPPPPGQPGIKGITVSRDMTFADFIKEWHLTPATVAAIEAMNQVAGHGHLTPSSKLHKGEVILRPVNS